MNRLPRFAFPGTYTLALALALVVGSGCSNNVDAPSKGDPKTEVEKDANPLPRALEVLRTAASTSDFRDGLRLFDAHLSKPDIRASCALGPEARAFLEKNFGLTREELEAVGATSFQPIDAHYLDQCFLLRDAVRALERKGLSTLERVRLVYDWVARQVVLREGPKEVLPPQYALERGLGTASERAVIFLELLRQMQVPGCVVAVKGPDEKTWRPLLAGAVITDGKASEIYLFHLYLGSPLPGPKGQAVATWSQLRRQPALLTATAKDSSTPALKVWIACPMEALSPRIRELERVLAAQDPVSLYMEPIELQKQVAAAAGEEIGVWSSKEPGQSPTRLWRDFLPVHEGGADQKGRMARFQKGPIPWFNIRLRYKALGFGALSPQALQYLYTVTSELFEKSTIPPRRAMLRGQLDRALKRLDWVRSALDDLDFAAVEGSELLRKADVWRNRAKDVYLALARKVPGSQTQVERFWAEDQYLLALVNALERPDPARHTRTDLTTFVLFTIRDTLGEQIGYWRALCWQEKAERLEAARQRPGSAGQRYRQDALDAWNNARGLWEGYLERPLLSEPVLRERHQAIQLQWQRGERDLAMGHWPLLVDELHRAAMGRLQLARAYARLGKSQQALIGANLLEKDLAALEESSDFYKDLATANKQAPRPVPFLEEILHDLGPDGGFAWLKKNVQALALQLKE
jgi:hypothetical protein